MLVDLVRVTTRDGLRLDGALRSPPENTPRTTSLDAVLFLHGVASNFYTSGVLEGIAPRLLKRGLTLLPVNTRGHDNIYSASAGFGKRLQGAAFETVDDCRHDVAAWLAFLKTQGFERILLMGHSLGAIKATYSQAIEPSPLVRGVLALSPPRLSHRAFLQAKESPAYFAALSTAEAMIADGRGDEIFLAKYPFPLMITASGYLDKYGPGERYNILRFAGNLKVPSLFTYGGREILEGPFAGVPEQLQQLPCDVHPLEVAVIDGGDHFYTGVYDGLAEEVDDWLLNHFPA